MKLKTLLAFITIAVPAALLTACDDVDKDRGQLVIPQGSFRVSKTQVALAGTESQRISIRSAVAPQVSSSAEWLHATAPELSGSGLYVTSVSADANPEYDDRSATLTIVAGDDRATVAVTQYASQTVRIDEVLPSATLEPGGGTLTVRYAATGDITVTAPEWLSQVSGRALSENELTFVYSMNNTGAALAGEIVLALASDASIKANVTVTQEPYAGTSDMSLNAKQLAAKMYAGINIGNTLECPTGEGAWSGAVVNLAYVHALKELGFNAVRIPCAWDSHVSDASTNTIDPAWLDRVDEVVGYVVSEGMYAILNIHWDGGWLEESCVSGYNEAVNKKQHDYWTQIANKLNHYDQMLLFAGMNEPGVQNQDGVDNASVDAIMAYQQTFLDAVRATGGNNATRTLVMQLPCTNIDRGTAGYYHLPTDVVADRMMVEAHFYDPYNFNMMEKDESWGKCAWYWGAENHVSGSDHNSTWGEETHVHDQMQKLKTTFVDKGYPCIIGEYAVCCTRTNTSGIDLDKHYASITYWNRVVTREAKNAGAVPFYWETGGDINRTNGATRHTRQLDGVFAGAAEGNYPF